MDKAKHVSIVPQTLQGQKSTAISQIFSMYKAQMAQILPRTVSVERLIQIFTTVVSRNPRLAACTTASLAGAMIQSAILNLDPTPQFGLCWFIPYKNKQGILECQFQMGYKGYKKLAVRTGKVKEIYAVCVYDKDDFQETQGLNRDLMHVPCIEDDRGKLWKVYAVIKYKEGGENFKVLSREKVYHIRAKSKSLGEDSPWNNDEDEMWLKTAIKNLLKDEDLETETDEIIQSVLNDGETKTAEMFNPTFEPPVVEPEKDIEDAKIKEEP
ncbi:MAG: recombinase RecT, partial [Patescibacteria group bacterium]